MKRRRIYIPRATQPEAAFRAVYPYGHDPVKYIEAWDRAKNLKPHPINWIRPSLGNFG